MSGATPEQSARELVERGADELAAGRLDDALATFDEVDHRFGADPTPGVRRWLASALGMRAVGLGHSGRLQEAVAGFDDLARRFHDDRDPEVRRQLAAALFNKGLAFAQMEQKSEALEVFDAVVDQFGDDTTLGVLDEVAGALENKARLLVTESRFDAAIAAVDEFTRRFGAGELAAPMRGRLASVLTIKSTLLMLSDRDAARDLVDQIVQICSDDPDPGIRRLAVDALDEHARALSKVGDLDAAAAAFGEIVRVFTGDDELVVAVAHALFNRGVALRDAGRLPEAVSALDEVATRFDGSADPELRRMVVGGLFNKAVVLSKMTDTGAALDAFDTVIQRFGGGDDPQVADWVRRSRLLGEEVRLGGRRSTGRILDADAPTAPEPEHPSTPEPGAAEEAAAATTGGGAAIEAEVADLIQQMHHLEYTGEAELALQLGTDRIRELGERIQGQPMFLLELNAARGWLQLVTGDAYIAEITLIEVWTSGQAAWSSAEATLAHYAECLGRWHLAGARDLREAFAWFKFALELRSNRVEDTAAYARTLTLLGAAVQRQGRVRRARKRLEREIEQLGESAGAAPVPIRPRLLTILAELCLREGRPTAAGAAARQASESATELLGADNPITAAANDLIDVSLRARPRPERPPGEDAEALRHAASAGLRLLDEEAAPQVASHVDELEALESQGRVQEALAVVAQLRTGMDRPTVDPATVALQLATGWLERAAGDDAAATRTFDRAYPAAYQAWARAEGVVSRAANSLGVLYLDATGDVTAAIEFLAAALRRRASRPEDRFLYAQTLVNLGKAYGSVGDSARAQRLLEEALRRVAEIPEVARRPERSQMLIILAEFRLRQGDAVAAEAAAREAIEIAHDALPTDNPTTAAAYRQLASSLQAQHRLAEARVHATQAVAMLDRCDPDSIAAAQTRVDLAELLVESGDLADAVGLLDRGSRYIDYQLRFNLELVPSDERLSVTMSDRFRLDYWLTLARREADHVPGLGAAAFDALERRRTIGTQVALALHDADAATPWLDAERQRLRALQRQASDRLLAAYPEGDHEYERLRREIGKAETLLSAGRRYAMLDPARFGLDKQRRRQRRERWMTPSAYLGAALEPGSALIEYARFRESPLRQGESPEEPERYLAFVQRSGDEPVEVVDLGEADHVDTLVQAFLAALATDGDFLLSGGALEATRSSSAAAARSLRAAVLDPLLSAVGGARQLLLVLDGALSGLPFQALNDDGDGYLIDRYQITYLSSAQDLWRAPPATSLAAGPPVVFADPDFDLELSSAQLQARDRGEDPFPRLSWTAAEGHLVGSMLGVSPVLGRDATEAALLGCERPRVLHIATHGWFLPVEDQQGDRPAWMDHPRLRHMANMAFLARPGVVVLGVTAEFSAELYGQLLVRCGLVTAGFNTAWAGQPLPPAAGDGLVTAADVAGLDLRGTELVVLSACETGLGHTIDFEGIHGLRLAFEMAGAATIITALWQVADESTATLMGEFYRCYVAGVGPAQGLGEAQLAIRRTHPHPYFWGGFVCQGRGPLGTAPPEREEGLRGDADAAAPSDERAAATAGHPAPRPAPQAAAEGALLARSAADHFRRGDVDAAERLWREAADAGDARSAHNLAVGLAEGGVLDEAEARYRQAAAAGLPQSANNLGELLWQRDDLDGAEQWLRRALDLGYEPAASMLGDVLHASGDDDEAERMWRRAAGADTAAAMKLAELLSGRGDGPEAMIWWRRAAEGGLAAAALRLGEVLCEEAPSEEGEQWLRRAADAGSPEAEQQLAAIRTYREQEAALAAEREASARAGDPQAAVDLGILAARRGDDAAALRWWRTAAARGHEHAALVLARLLASRGEDQEAEALVRPLAARHNAAAAHLLGILLERRGAREEAEQWLRRAVDGGEREAKNDLGLLMWERGQHSDAERLWRTAAEAGSGEAARNLAAALEQSDRADEAVAWLRISADAGNAEGARSLGVTLYRQGNRIEGERWLRRAAVAGYPAAMSSLGRLLAQRGDPEAEEWLRRAADAGEPEVADALSQILAARGAREEAEVWRRRAVDEARRTDSSAPRETPPQ